jgi:predicted NUDIX family NTP pyrophosphohydrolase
MVKLSAGILPYRFTPNGVEVMLVHPGGPFWVKKDDGAWSIPKGEYNEAEDPHAAAKREFAEETGMPAPEGDLTSIGEVKYGNKKVICWAAEGDYDLSTIKSNMITIDWPPNSGKTMQIPECDKADWFNLATAKAKLVKGQVPFIDNLADMLRMKPPETPTLDDTNQLSLL